MIKYLRTISELAVIYKIPVYIVGGAVRDKLLDKEVRDFDLVLKGDISQIKKISKEFSRRFNGDRFTLDSKRGVFRVIVDIKEFDYNQLRGRSIIEDLSKRDFTCNALAFPLFFEENKYNNKITINKSKIIDPYKGIKDIKNKKIRILNKNVFVDDPLRLLRAVRFKFLLNFALTSDTRLQILRDKTHLQDVSGERINEELNIILENFRSIEFIDFLEDELGLLSVLIPEINEMKKMGKCYYHKEDIWTHSKLLLKELDKILNKDLLNLKELKVDLSGELTNLRVAALFHDIGKVKTQQKTGGRISFPRHPERGAEIMENHLKELRFSGKDIKFISDLIKLHMYPLQLFNNQKISNKAIYRFFRKAKNRTPAVCLLSAADVISTRRLNGPYEEIDKYKSFIKKLLLNYRRWDEERQNILLDGKEIMTVFGLEEGPYIGELKEKLHRAQMQGIVKDRQSAIDYLKKEIKENYNKYN